MFRFLPAFLLLVFAAARVAAASAPNILFLLADDLRWDALGCQGNPIIQTPNVDALAARGMRFKQSFVTTSICCVSRATLFSGQYMRRHGIGDFEKPFTVEQWSECYPSLLRKAGYHTGFIGKFGVGNSRAIAAMEQEFDFWRGLPGQGGPFIDPKDPSRTHATARFGSQALDFIRSAPPERPWCLSVSFTAPHARDGKPREFEPDQRDEVQYADRTVPIPKKASEQFFQMLPALAQTSEGRKRWALRFDTSERSQSTLRDYFRLVSGIDREVGRIVSLLRELGMNEKTVIIFASDNGFFYGERGLADKWLMYEESIRVPLIITDPRVPETMRGADSDRMVLNNDVAPTILDLGGVPVPSRMQGRSLMPLVRGESPANWRTDFFYEHHFGEKRDPVIPATEGVRETRWKYTRWTGAEPPFEELFDLESDPEELRNLARDSANEPHLERLRNSWAKYEDQLR